MIRRVLAGTAMALSLALAGCVPWTVRPIGESGESKGESAQTSNPAAYVDSIWSAKLVPAVTGGAADARAVLDAIAASPEAALEKFGRGEAGGPRYVLVKGTGKVLALDTRSKAGLLMVDVAPFDGRADLSIQAGPVLRGTALRDSTGIVRFTDFVNQLQFADAAIELNNRVAKTVLGPLELSALVNRTVAFAGAGSVDGAARPPIKDVMPVRLEAAP